MLTDNTRRQNNLLQFQVAALKVCKKSAILEKGAVNHTNVDNSAQL